MKCLIPETAEEPLLAEREVELRAAEEASDLFLASLLEQAEKIKDREVTEWQTCPMI